jgi:hypothetical protein
MYTAYIHMCIVGFMTWSKGGEEINLIILFFLCQETIISYIMMKNL